VADGFRGLRQATSARVLGAEKSVLGAPAVFADSIKVRWSDFGRGSSRSRRTQRIGGAPSPPMTFISVEQIRGEPERRAEQLRERPGEPQTTPPSIERPPLR
jgi:hypothetical protein